jgi:hypothetical protein
MNKDIFLKFLESDDWNNEKTYNLFMRLNGEYIDKISDLEEQSKFYQEKFEEVKDMMKTTLKKYDDILRISEELKAENDKLKYKIMKSVSTQTYIHNINQATIDYDICDKKSSLVLTNNKTISKLHLDKMWVESQDIIKTNSDFKEKNRELLLLFCNYKKELLKLMGKNWYKKCISSVEIFAKTKDEEHVDLYFDMISLIIEVFDNEW